MKRVVGILFLIILSATALTAGVDETLSIAAGAAYDRGDYADAIQLYSQIPIRDKSAEIFANLALAEAHLGHLGPCILNLRHALALVPNDSVLWGALDAVLDFAALPHPCQCWRHRFASAFSPNGWILVFVGAFWLGLFALSIYPLVAHLRRYLLSIGILSLFFNAAAIIGMRAMDSMLDDAIVVRAAPTYDVPSENVPPVFFLKEGEAVHINGQVNNLLFIETLSKKTFYTSCTTCKPVIPIP
ncbi:MAG: hypothetical protein LBI34_01455 [Puniceicoccales bacterium]|jgi:hypothetical protein|nr:hypothetical protein [Puniceicoccales bacterium]